MTPSCSVHADAAFAIGQSHLDNAKPCQDYALAQDVSSDTAVAWAAVSDGCSTAGLTDVGARMWVHAVRHLLRAQKNSTELFFGEQDALREALLAAAAPLLLPFERADARATVLVVGSDGRRARAVVFGDGVVAARGRDGSLTTWTVEYERNAPRYLSYDVTDAAGENETAAWRALVGDSKVSVKTDVFDFAGNRREGRVESSPAREFPGLMLDWPDVTGLQCLMVATDGAHSFDSQEHPYGVSQLLAIKNPTGQFFHRRLGAMARGWKKGVSAMPQDDLGAGLLWFSHQGCSHE